MLLLSLNDEPNAVPGLASNVFDSNSPNNASRFRYAVPYDFISDLDFSFNNAGNLLK